VVAYHFLDSLAELFKVVIALGEMAVVALITVVTLEWNSEAYPFLDCFWFFFFRLKVFKIFYEFTLCALVKDACKFDNSCFLLCHRFFVINSLSF